MKGLRRFKNSKPKMSADAKSENRRSKKLWQLRQASGPMPNLGREYKFELCSDTKGSFLLLMTKLTQAPKWSSFGFFSPTFDFKGHDYAPDYSQLHHAWLKIQTQCSWCQIGSTTLVGKNTRIKPNRNSKLSVTFAQICTQYGVEL